MTAFAALRHHTVREGFEVVFLGDRRFEGQSTGFEDGAAWTVDYDIELDGAGCTRRARITTRDASGVRSILLEGGDGRWRIDGAPATHLDGLLDVDLEASAVTNAFPVRRLDLAPGERVEAPAAWVRLDSTVERLEQRYHRLDAARYAYEAPGLGFAAELVYDRTGLILEYPGIATRVA